MPDPAVLQSLNLGLRGGVIVLLLIIAAGLLRERNPHPALKLGAALALGGAAYAVCSTPGFHARAGLWSAPFLALAVGNNVVLWLFARTLFTEGFRLRRTYLALWAALAGLGVANGLGWTPHALVRPIGLFLAGQAIAFASLAIVQTISSWPSDLVDSRRRLRVILVGGSALHVILTAAAGLAPRLDSAPLVRLADVGAETLLAAVVAWSIVQVSAGAMLAKGQAALAANGPPPAELDPADTGLLRRLERAMSAERAYREEGLTIGRLAARLDAPEYRLRRVINQGLGQRNFAAYLNGHRLAEAKAALEDPTQAEVPILTIALDAGFGSLGPFNRAFKQATGLTPTEYRRTALGDSVAAAA